jgi:hypothetical protein
MPVQTTTVEPLPLFPPAPLVVTADGWLYAAQYWLARAEDYDAAHMPSVAAELRAVARECQERVNG